MERRNIDEEFDLKKKMSFWERPTLAPYNSKTVKKKKEKKRKV